MMSNKRDQIFMKLSKRFSSLAVFLMAVTMISCRGQLSDKPPIHPQQNMYHQDRFNAQEENPFFEDNRSMRPPVEGTIARGQLKQDKGFFTGIDEDENYVEENPMTLTSDFLYRGQDRYDIYCSVCHGGVGDGQGIIMTGQYGYVPAPSFHTDQIRDMPDGQIYSAIYHGVRTMPDYRTQIKVEDRWAIVAYVRALQESQTMPEEMIREYDVDIAALEEAQTRELEAEAEIEEELDDDELPLDDVSAERGEQLFAMQGCQACHSTDGSAMIGPTLSGVYDHEVELDDGSTVTADEDYLFESIVEPAAKIVAGYPNVMQPYAHLDEDEVDSLIEFIKTLADND